MPKKILIVEDYAVNRSFVKIFLEDLGYEVYEAENGEKAIDSVIEEAPDLIFMDLAMPGMNGLTALKSIREIKGMKNVPVIAVTAYGQFYYRQAMDAGFDDFVTKPFDPEILEPLINRYLAS